MWKRTQIIRKKRKKCSQLKKFKNKLARREIRNKKTGNKRNNFKLKPHTKNRFLTEIKSTCW